MGRTGPRAERDEEISISGFTPLQSQKMSDPSVIAVQGFSGYQIEASRPGPLSNTVSSLTVQFRVRDPLQQTGARTAQLTKIGNAIGSRPKDLEKSKRARQVSHDLSFGTGHAPPCSTVVATGILRCAIMLSPACKRVMPQHDPNSSHAIVRCQACRNPIDISWKPKAAKPQPVPAETRAIEQGESHVYVHRASRSADLKKASTQMPALSS
ncbi:hypothetical protein B0T20DRAFT_469914 [Sordaria brevicollis]|uniref:Uncharacterized protein n=1 Tax=Sordaria brevicollis TaxID=83679 RepID=A0AAE0PCV9_SORBR|nr:hypothetical protein B0T20DRAFT_469914 [Sordaria brevicollis]